MPAQVRRAAVADPGCFSDALGVRQGTQHRPAGAEQVQDAVVEADGDPASGEVEPDRVLPAGEREQAGGIDGPFDLDRRAQLDRPSTDRWRSGWSVVIGKQLMQVGEA